MKLLKNTSGQTIALNLDNSILHIAAGDTVDYNTYVSHSTSANTYNLDTIQNYIDNGILTVVTNMPVPTTSNISQVNQYIIVNFAPAVYTQLIAGPGDHSVKFTNLTNSTTDITWLWEVLIGGSVVVSSTEFSPTIAIPGSGIFSVQLTATAASGATGFLLNQDLIYIPAWG